MDNSHIISIAAIVHAMRNLPILLSIFLWTFSSVLGQCPIEDFFCSCEFKEAIIQQYTCENLGNITDLPNLGTSDDIIQNIKISDSIVQYVADESFSGLKTRTLDLRELQLKYLESNAFLGLELYIENIYLADNEIEKLPISLFLGMAGVRTLTLDRNKLSEIQEGQFSGLSSLSHLGLEANGIGNLSVESFYGLTNLKYLYLPYNNIQILPDGIFDSTPNLVELHITNNEIVSLSSTLFSKLTFLEDLLMSTNKIENLPEAIFDNNRNLKTIDLDSNQISSSLTNGHFVGPRDVEKIDLSFNNLTDIHPSTFHNLRMLKALFLDNNRLTTVGSSAFEGLERMERLHLQGNEIENLLTNAFIGMPNLKLLDLSRNRIHKLTFGIFDPFGKLTELYLSRNSIESIEHGPFITLRSLEILDMSFNRIHQVTNDWFVQREWEKDSKPLRELYLQHNAIRHLDLETLWPLKSLEKLDISENSLFSLNSTVFKTLDNIKEVHFSSNPLLTLPKGLLSKLNNVETLKISDTCLTELKPQTFQGMSQLKQLDVSNNFLASVSQESFDGIGNLTSLNMSFNNLSTMQSPVFSKISDSLEVLYLQNNVLTTKGLGDNLDNTTNLKILDLSFNALTYTDGLFSVIRTQSVLLRMQQNPYVCDCNMAWMLNYNLLVDYEGITCGSPEDIQGESAICYRYPFECNADFKLPKFDDYCASYVSPTQSSNSSEPNGVIVIGYTGKTMEEFTKYCTEPKVVSTTPKPDTGNQPGEEEPLPDPLAISVHVDYTTVTVTWPYSNNTRIVGYKITAREFGEQELKLDKLHVKLKITNWVIDNLQLDKNYIICVDIVLNDDSLLKDDDSCKEVKILSDTLTTRPPPAESSADNDSDFPMVPVIIACIAVVVVLVIILAIVFICLKSKPKEDENKYMDDRLRDKMGMWVNSFSYNGGINEQIAEQTTVEVDIFAPVEVIESKSSKKSNGHVPS